MPLSLDTLFALSLFSVISSITPGPNNIMVLSSGVNFGLRRSMPHILGISLGFFVLCMACGMGLGSLLLQFPHIHSGLKILAVLYLLYLAYKIATSRSLSQASTSSQPFTLLQATMFQWVNPKGWMMAVTAMIMYTLPAQPFYSTLWVSLIFGILCFPCILVWCLFGTLLRQFLSDPKRLRYFNMCMGLLLVLCLYPIIKT